MSDNKEKTFMTSLKDMLRNTFTGKDNQTLDLGRLLWAKGVFVYFGLTVYDLYNICMNQLWELLEKEIGVVFLDDLKVVPKKDSQFHKLILKSFLLSFIT